MKRPGMPARKAWMPRGTKPLPKVNPRQQAARRKRYAKALKSAHTRAIRAQVFEEQGGLCVCRQEPMTTLEHLTYARLGHELREDVVGLGDRCNARETMEKRANWMGGRRA